jgi:hypothetical protein
VKKVIMEAPKEKAPGLDGFIGLFFSKCWNIIREDNMGALHQLYFRNQQGLHFLNQALVVLIPKKENPQKITDYRPISLAHRFVTIISKILADRLSPQLQHIISVNQSAFIQKRCIHDNFLYVQEVIKDLYKRKILALFIKLDIAKAFDTLNWTYLLSIMEHLGFGLRWRNWIAALWNTTSSTFLVNGESEKRILHCIGVRQGDPLSPLLFIMAMEPLHRLIKKAQQMGHLSSLSRGSDNFRISMYVDVAALFISPSKKDFQTITEVLRIFAAASGLHVNMSKTKIFPIKCDANSLSHIIGSGMILS